MKKTYIIVGVVVLALIGWYTLGGKTAGPVVDTTPVPAAPQVTAQNSLRTLLNEKKPLECVYKDSGEGAEVSGVVYLDNGKMAADFETKGTAAGNVKSSIIYDGKDFYVWSSALATLGLKMNGADFEKSKSLSLDEQKSYDCKDWKSVASKFVPPKTVTFQAVSNLLQPTAAESKVFTCAACGKLPPSQALQCKQKNACK